MDELISLLHTSDCCGVVCSPDGTLSMFHRRGVIDLYDMLVSRRSLLAGASVADKVVGKGAAMLMVLGGVSRVYAGVMSVHARDYLVRHRVETLYGTLVDNIFNRAHDGFCPVETLTRDVDDPDEAFMLIGNFIKNMKK